MADTPSHKDLQIYTTWSQTYGFSITEPIRTRANGELETIPKRVYRNLRQDKPYLDGVKLMVSMVFKGGRPSDKVTPLHYLDIPTWFLIAHEILSGSQGNPARNGEVVADFKGGPPSSQIQEVYPAVGPLASRHLAVHYRAAETSNKRDRAGNPIVYAPKYSFTLTLRPGREGDNGQVIPVGSEPLQRDFFALSLDEAKKLVLSVNQYLEGALRLGHDRIYQDLHRAS